MEHRGQNQASYSLHRRNRVSQPNRRSVLRPPIRLICLECTLICSTLFTRIPLISTPTGPMQHMQHLQGGGFRIYPCLFLASLLDEERRVSDPSDPNSQPCAELFVLIGGTIPLVTPLSMLLLFSHERHQACPRFSTTSPPCRPALRETCRVS